MRPRLVSIQAGLPDEAGWYHRVLTEGVVAAGQPFTLLERGLASA